MLLEMPRLTDHAPDGLPLGAHDLDAGHGRGESGTAGLVLRGSIAPDRQDRGGK